MRSLTSWSHARVRCEVAGYNNTAHGYLQKLPNLLLVRLHAPVVNPQPQGR